MRRNQLHNWLKGNAQHKKISSFYEARLRCQELGGNSYIQRQRTALYF